MLINHDPLLREINRPLSFADEDFVIEGYVRWESLAGAEIGSLSALEETIDDLQRNAENASPIIVEAERADGKALSIGLGREEAVLSFTPASKKPPYYVSSAGRQGSEDEETVVYHFYGQCTQVPRRFLVPMKDAREALRIFWRTGELTNDIVWEEV